MPRKVNVMGLYSQTSEEKKAYHWCINNGIFISPFATGEGTWYIDIKINNYVKIRSCMAVDDVTRAI